MKNSGVEIELKIPLFESPDEFLKRFANSGKRTYEKTVMFDNEQGLMQKTNGRVRLREIGEIVTLSYKRPLPSDTVKKEIEWETQVNNWEIGENLLKAMGFNETTSYEKYRTSFEYEGVKLEVDEYPFANFLEIEGEEEIVKRVALDLGFNLSLALVKACDTLFTEWRAAKGLPMKPHMRFEDYDK